MGIPKGHYVGHLAPQVLALGHPRSLMWLQGVPGWPHGDKTRSLEGQNSEIGDSYTFLIDFKGLWEVRGESFPRAPRPVKFLTRSRSAHSPQLPSRCNLTTLIHVCPHAYGVLTHTSVDTSGGVREYQ